MGDRGSSLVMANKRHMLFSPVKKRIAEKNAHLHLFRENTLTVNKSNIYAVPKSF
jgi:hypothetical protein